MGLINWMNEKIKRMNVLDMGCIKWASLLLGAIIGAYIAGFVKQYLWVFVVLTIVLVIRPIYTIFKK